MWHTCGLYKITMLKFIFGDNTTFKAKHSKDVSSLILLRLKVSLT